jgi:hypothetical protein
VRPRWPVLLDRGKLERAVHFVWVLDEVLNRDCPLIKATKDLCCSCTIAVDGEEDDLKEVLSARVT